MTQEFGEDDLHGEILLPTTLLPRAPLRRESDHLQWFDQEQLADLAQVFVKQGLWFLPAARGSPD